jgi:hypothetical protein
MASNDAVLNFILLLISIIIALLANSLLLGIGAHWAAIISLIILFALLYLFAKQRGWTAPFKFPVVGSSRLSELFLSLLLLTTSLALAWFLGVAISRAFTEVEGVLASLCIFGVLMLAVSSYRSWQ